MVKRFLGLLMALSLTCSPGLGQKEKAAGDENKAKAGEAQNQMRLHEEVVVTALAPSRAVKDCSLSVSVVRNEDIKAAGTSNALSLLGFWPGIFVQQTGDFGRADIHIRGVGQYARRVTILVDGRPEKMGLFGCAVTHAFPLDNIERIEVVRGPASVLYGSEAMGGVINLITRVPQKKSETEVVAAYGSFATHWINLRQGGKFNRWSYFFTFDRRQSQGHLPHSDYHGRALTGKLTYNLSTDLRLLLNAKYFDGRKSEYGPVDFPLIDFWNHYQRGSFDLTLEKISAENNLLLKVYKNFGHHQFSDGWHSRDEILGSIFRSSFRLGPANELTLGGDVRILAGKSYNQPKGSWEKKEWALFGQDELVIRQKFILSAGLRLHHDSIFGFKLSPHFGLVFKVDEKTTWRAAVNHGFRSPQLNELYIFPSSNPELRPEGLWNYEMGLQRRIGRVASLGLTVFHFEAIDLIETSLNPYPPPKFKFLNTGSYKFSGAELTFEAAFNRNLSLLLFYSYLYPREKTRGRPGHKWDGSLRWGLNETLFLSLQGQYVTSYYAEDFHRRRLSPYFLLNSRLEARIFSPFAFFGEIRNLLDDKYYRFVDIPGIAAGVFVMPGRSLNFGCQIKL